MCREQVLFIDVSAGKTAPTRQFELACTFCGLNVIRLFTEGKDSRKLIDSLKLKYIQAIVITARALANPDIRHLMSAIKCEDGKRRPLMIIGVTPEVDSGLLDTLSGHKITGCRSSITVPFHGFYKFSESKSITRQLGGLDIPFACEWANYFSLDETSSVETIIYLTSAKEEAILPIFVKTVLNGQEVFFLTEIGHLETSDESISYFTKKDFLEIAPLVMFLRYACGQKCWHTPGHYANLTIDDPWLREPYGFLSYKGLLKEMEKVNFHTTIGFIPWNYDRNEKDVVSLFREHPDRFSICVHGNNHDHYEFYKYETNKEDPWSARPLNLHEANIKQAIARMEKFQDMMGLSYDSVMVFPHSIAPAKTLGLLKRYNFLATSNAAQSPLGSEQPNDPLFSLKPAILDFENFATIDRYWPKERTKADIAIDLFLGNPICYHNHHDLFKDGIDSFNETAEMINDIEPKVRWQSLGYIARHLYIQRVRSDGNYDVRAFCRSIELENTQKRDMAYYVRKEESFSPSIRQVTVDGKPHSYEISDSDLCLTLSIPSGESRFIDIEYENDFDFTSIDISKSDSRVNRLRKLSDFRDITLSKSILGRTFANVYYKTGFYKSGLKRLLTICFLPAAIICSVGRYLSNCIRKRSPRKPIIEEKK